MAARLQERQAADDTNVIATPERSVVNAHPVRERIGVGELYLLDNLTRLGVVFEKRVQV